MKSFHPRGDNALNCHSLKTKTVISASLQSFGTSANIAEKKNKRKASVYHLKRYEAKINGNLDQRIAKCNTKLRLNIVRRKENSFRNCPKFDFIKIDEFHRTNECCVGGDMCCVLSVL